MILSDPKRKSMKEAHPQISPAAGEPEGKELVSERGLLCAGLCCCSSYIIALTVHHSPAQEVLLPL